jgi:hypothetical protein
MALWLLLGFIKPKKSKHGAPERYKETKPFVFSNEKQYIASRKTHPSEPQTTIIPRAALVKEQKPLPPAAKTSIPNPTEPLKKKAEALATGSPPTPPLKKAHTNSSSETVDFDQLENLIEDFFSEGQNSKLKSP